MPYSCRIRSPYFCLAQHQFQLHSSKLRAASSFVSRPNRHIHLFRLFYMPPLRRTLALANLTFANLNDENQPEITNPLPVPSIVKPPVATSLPRQSSPFDPRPLRRTLTYLTLANLNVENQPQKNNPLLMPSIIKATSLPRQSSPLGPCQHLLPVRPVFPRSVRKPNLYRQALKKSARLANQSRRRS